jgi:type III pantothenate kinase
MARGESVLTVNVGNTRTSVVAWRDGSAARHLTWETGAPLPRVLPALLAGNLPVILAGVVPAYRKRLTRQMRRLGSAVLVFRKDIVPPIEIVPRPARRVGDDRIAGALGALALGSTRPWVVVDVGTAITVNAVTPGKATRLPRFEGGLIVPGAAISLRALAEHTAQLPRLVSQHGTGRLSVIGRSTQEAMQLGVQHAQAATVIALARAQLQELGPRARVVFTGGGSGDPVVARAIRQAFTAHQARFAPALVHVGLMAAWLASRCRSGHRS